MKYLKRLMYSVVGIPIVLTAILHGIWFEQEVDNESWKFWEF